MSGFKPLEHVTRVAALGLRFWDTAEATSAIDGLTVEVFPRSNPSARLPALPNRSGVYVAHRVKGLHDFEFGLSDAWAASPLWSLPYRVEVSDPQGRFLPVAFDADLPARGLFTFGAPWLSPPFVALPNEPGSPLPALIERIPLFSAPTRPVPDPFAVIYAQLREDVWPPGRAAAWCLLGVSIGGASCGLGLADRNGRVAVMFPYPEPPRRTLASPPEARNDFTWEVELTAFRSPASPALAAPSIPDLEVLLQSLQTPGDVVISRVSPAIPLRLTYRQALTVRTGGLAGDDASYLYVSA